ncbi:hypothetical protein V1290_000363 [Bradyrhizobium sp. AZCC 1578]|uniref:DUF6603 domain-containing protein n=1 Tax=Bradyrhizobium sp. AZCC 1578 TaxID=3117027 RepID=UPI002FF422B2
MSDSDFLPTLARHLGLAVQPLADAVANLEHFQTFMLSLGWSVDDLPPAYTALGSAVDGALDAVTQLVDDPSIEHAAAVLEEVRQLYTTLKGIGDAPAGVDVAVFLESIADRIFELLLVDYLMRALPDVWTLCRMTGVITIRPTPPAGSRPAFVEKRFRFDQIPAIVADPLSLPERVYGWGTAELNFPRVVDHLHDLCTALHIPAGIDRVRDPDDAGFSAGLQAPGQALPKPVSWELRIPIARPVIADEVVPVDLVVVEFPADEGRLPGLALRPSIPSSLTEEVELADDLKLKIRAGSDIASAFGIIVRPGDVLVRYPFAPGTQPPSAGFGVSLDYNPPAPSVLLGSAGATRLEFKGAESSLGFAFTQGELELQLASDVHGLQAVLALGDQDSFLASLFANHDLTIPIQLGIRWSNKRGLAFTGGAGFEITVAPHLELGSITIDTVHLAVLASLSSGAPPALTAGADVGIHGAIGPIGFAIDGLGVTLTATFASGNAGPFDVSTGFKPPTGLGVSIDTSLVTGGGFLSHDVATGRYAGILQLRIAKVGLTAIGLLDTRLPDGNPGYSFLIIIAATFPTIQLGYGFTLNGAGGLAGVNRTVAIDAIQAGLRTGALDRVLFPDNPIANANQILSDIRTIFPPAQGRYVFGPMALLGWCTPTLVHIKVGLILEVPLPIRLLLVGSLSMALPKEDEALVALHIDFLGVPDLESLRVSVLASLHDSHVAAFAISGDMAFLLDCGSDPALILAVGGVNPHYQPPAGFPMLQPLTVSLGLGENPRITLKGYLARTANTSQVGALAELYAEYGGFNIYGWIGFDAMFSYLPFAFVTDFSGGVKLSRGSTKLAGVSLSATLSGVSPFHAKGRACVSLWLFDVCVGFDHTFGDLKDIVLAVIEPLPPLLAALGDPLSWSGTLPTAVWRAASVTTPLGETRVLIDPVGGIMLREQVLPLNRTITKFGEGKPSAPVAYNVTAVRVAGEDIPWTAVQDQFAPAQFAEFSDAEKLSLPSFAKMDAGFEIVGTGVKTGPGLGTDLVYETRIVDRPWAGAPAPDYPLPLRNQLVMVASGAAGRAPFRRTGPEKFSTGRALSGPAVTVSDESFVIAGVADLAVRQNFGTGLSQHGAYDILSRHLALHPEDRGTLQVVLAAEGVLRG